MAWTAYIEKRMKNPTAAKPAPRCERCGEKLRDPETTVYIKRKDKTELFFHPDCFIRWYKDV